MEAIAGIVHRAAEKPTPAPNEFVKSRPAPALCEQFRQGGSICLRLARAAGVGRASPRQSPFGAAAVADAQAWTSFVTPDFDAEG